MIKNMNRRFLILMVLLFVLSLSSVSANAAWKKTSSGKMYTISESPGYAVGWKKISGKYYYFNSKGILQKKTWVDGCYVGKKGYRLTGMVKIGQKTYYLDKKTGKKVVKSIVKYKDKFYYFNSKGVLQKNSWIHGKYYAAKNGQLITGLASIKGNLYFFNRKTAQMMSNILVTTGGASYYFKKDGTAVKGQRVLRKGNYYYFGTNGKMVRSGWAKINTIQYYFDSNGVMVTDLQTIGDKQYYFYSSGVLATSTTITVGSKIYTVNEKGVVTKTETVHASSLNTGKKIANFAVQYVGNRYVYGGNSLTNGVDCSGFTQQVFLHFGINLPRIADSQMKMSEGGVTYRANVISRSNIEPGDVLCFGSGNYASHVGIYIGNDQFVHASNSQPYPRGGIKISTLSTYPTTLLRIVRYW